MAPQRHGYYSSLEKDFIRERFDLPLLTQLRTIRGDRLNYFGLPGADLKDVKSWQHLLGEVAGVERSRSNLQAMEETVSMEMPDLRFTPHFGEVDVVILRNRGYNQKRDGMSYRPWVGISRPGASHLGWYFDVVNLDYFGPFLPEDDKQARRRSDAQKALFNEDRLNSWGRWVLLLTVEAQLEGNFLAGQLAEYLRGVQYDASEPAASIIESLSKPVANEDRRVNATRLIHGASVSLIARSASQGNLVASPRGTILYQGSGGKAMVHMAFEFTPHEAVLPPPSPLLRLLKGPLLTTAQGGGPVLSLLNGQIPDLTSDDIRASVSFLPDVEIDRLAAQLL